MLANVLSETEEWVGAWVGFSNKKNKSLNQWLTFLLGGSGEIRTHERVPPSAVFKTAAFNHSATLPWGTGIIHKSLRAGQS
jgi:hypothetical protein